jgi:hypothetical protein
LNKILLYKKIRNYHSLGTVPKSNRKIIERGKIGIPNTQT